MAYFGGGGLGLRAAAASLRSGSRSRWVTRHAAAMPADRQAANATAMIQPPIAVRGSRIARLQGDGIGQTGFVLDDAGRSL
jgi:hypothetical protein